MDKIICIIEPHRALVYDLGLGKAMFQQEHSLEELPLFLRTLQAWNCTLHILDLSSTPYFKWERVPEGLTWWERMQWFRQKTKQVSQDGHYSLFQINHRQRWLWSLKITKPVFPQWIEEKLQAQSIPLFYHSYPLELVKTIKIHFDTLHEKAQCFILKRLDSPSIFAVYYGNNLIFLRVLFPIPQESLVTMIQETIRHVEESFHIHILDFICLGDREACFTEISNHIPEGQFYYAGNLERWMEHHSILPVMGCESLLDRFVLAQGHGYQILRLRGKRFFFNTLEPKLRRFAWIQIVPLIGGIGIHFAQWKRESKINTLRDDLHRQWNTLSWTEKEFLNAEAKLQSNHNQLSKTSAHVSQLEQVLSDKTILQKIEWTQGKGWYWFIFAHGDKTLQKNLLSSAWKQYVSLKKTIEWQESLPASIPHETVDLECGEGGSPFSRDP